MKSKIKIVEENQWISETKSILDELVNTFFGLFSVKEGCKVDLSAVNRLFIPEGVIIKNTDSAPEIYNLQQFIEPREKMLNEGVLIDFKEEELFEKTEIFGNIAHRFSLYKKSGVLSGTTFETKGMKTIQFIKTPNGWKMSSLAWDDEKEGLSVPDEYSSCSKR